METGLDRPAGGPGHEGRELCPYLRLLAAIAENPHDTRLRGYRWRQGERRDDHEQGEPKRSFARRRLERRGGCTRTSVGRADADVYRRAGSARFGAFAV